MSRCYNDCAYFREMMVDERPTCKPEKNAPKTSVALTSATSACPRLRFQSDIFYHWITRRPPVHSKGPKSSASIGTKGIWQASALSLDRDTWGKPKTTKSSFTKMLRLHVERQVMPYTWGTPRKQRSSLHKSRFQSAGNTAFKASEVWPMHKHRGERWWKMVEGWTLPCMKCRPYWHAELCAGLTRPILALIFTQ